MFGFHPEITTSLQLLLPPEACNNLANCNFMLGFPINVNFAQLQLLLPLSVTLGSPKLHLSLQGLPLPQRDDFPARYNIVGNGRVTAYITRYVHKEKYQLFLKWKKHIFLKQQICISGCRSLCIEFVMFGKQ